MNLRNIIKFILLFFLLAIVLFASCYFYSLEIQINLLNAQIENLGVTIEMLQKTEFELKNQILLKNQQIKLLTDSVNQIKANIISSSNLLDSYNFEVIKEDIIRTNTSEWTQFAFKITGIIAVSIVLAVGANSVRELVLTEVINLKFVDTVNGLMWTVRIPENKKIVLFVKKVTPEFFQEPIVECVKTIVLKTPNTLFSGASDGGVELVCSSAAASERIMAASQITEVLSSVGVY